MGIRYVSCLKRLELIGKTLVGSDTRSLGEMTIMPDWLLSNDGSDDHPDEGGMKGLRVPGPGHCYLYITVL